MITSEFEYYLLQELITMPNRELAQKIELHIWYRSSVPQPKILAKYLSFLDVSEKDFVKKAEIYLQESGLEFIMDEDNKFMTRTRNANPPDYVDDEYEWHKTDYGTIYREFGPCLQLLVDPRRLSAKEPPHVSLYTTVENFVQVTQYPFIGIDEASLKTYVHLARETISSWLT